MNTANDKQSETSETARVTYAETCDASGETLPGFNAAQSARILARLAIERASAAGKLANVRAWAMADTIAADIAGKLATLRARHALLDRI